MVRAAACVFTILALYDECVKANTTYLTCVFATLVLKGAYGSSLYMTAWAHINLFLIYLF